MNAETMECDFLGDGGNYDAVVDEVIEFVGRDRYVEDECTTELAV